ncbi:GH92 family glycosyl hydrolase [Paenibacillus foliorum]|nr:GH92 family glycosyl hydrolase [Paenibacillus foliorum]
MNRTVKQISVLLLILLIAVMAVTASWAPSYSYAEPLEDGRLPLTSYVDPFIGTTGAGHTYPGAQAPFGMIQLGPDTGDRPGGAGYNGDNPYIQSFSLTHLSGVGCDAASDIPIIPSVQPLLQSPVHNQKAYQHIKGRETASPGYYKAELSSSGVEVELASATRSGLGRFVFPAAEEQASILIVPPNNTVQSASSALTIDPATRTISGHSSSGGFCNSSNTYKLYFYAQFDTPFANYGTWDERKRVEGNGFISGDQAATYVRFDTKKSTTVTMRMGLSFVSVDNAKLNMVTEIQGRDLEAVRTETAAAWNKLLSRIQVEGGSADSRKLFYTSLYHACLQPGIFNDVNGQYPGFDDQIYTMEQGRNMYATFSLWDTYRTQPQLLALLAPDVASDMVNSLLVNSRQTTAEAGGFPGWSYYNDDPNIMATYPAPLYIANAFAFGARQFDTVEVKTKFIEAATSLDTMPRASSADNNGAQWWGLEHYMRSEYVDSVSATLEYAMTDFAIAMFSRSLGDDESFRYFRNRSQHAFSLFNSSAAADGGYFQRRNQEGEWIVPFSPTSSDGFTEGNAAQYNWSVPHNIAELIRLMGGEEAFSSRLDHHLSVFKKDGWPIDSPYWWSGNEPGMVTPFLYNWAGKPWKTQEKLHDILSTQWSARKDGIPGNDDTGTASAWYVWAALGLYPAIPGVGGFTLFTPLFDKIDIQLADNKSIRIETRRGEVSDSYIHQTRLNGSDYASTWISLQELTSKQSSKLEFSVGSSPGTWGTGIQNISPSFGPIGKNEPTNLAFGKLMKAEGSCQTTETSGLAADGNDWTKWCYASNEDKTLQVDLGGAHTISRWVVKHAGVAEWPMYNTKDFGLQVSMDGIQWMDADYVTGNTEAITDRSIAEVSAKYVRLVITNPTQNDDKAARIYEFEVYGWSGE